ncbi:MAG: TolC family protein, partial [Burkholderiaceae bacterium]|nr:TolC family protein [Burkholderiaceae bacterium]
QRSLLDVRIAETQLSEMRGRHLPTVELYAQQQYRDRSQGTFFADSNEHRSSFGVELNWEIFVGGEVQSQVREAELKLTSQREKAEALRLSIDSEIKKHLLAVDLGKHRIQANMQRTLSAQRKLEATRDGRELGIRSNLDILKAEKDSSDAKRGLAEAYHTYYQARLHLALEQGCLNDRVIGVLSAALDVSDDSTTTSRAG